MLIGNNFATFRVS